MPASAPLLWDRLLNRPHCLIVPNHKRSVRFCPTSLCNDFNSVSFLQEVKRLCRICPAKKANCTMSCVWYRNAALIDSFIVRSLQTWIPTCLYLYIDPNIPSAHRWNLQINTVWAKNTKGRTFLLLLNISEWKSLYLSYIDKYRHKPYIRSDNISCRDPFYTRHQPFPCGAPHIKHTLNSLVAFWFPGTCVK